MVYAGQQVENTVTGEIFVFDKTAKETNGTSFVMTWTIKPGHPLPFAHLHPALEEQIHVLRGELRVILGGVTRVLRRDDRITIPKNTLHQAFNGGETPVICRVTFTPAAGIGETLETLGWLAAHDHLSKRGDPPFMALIVLGEAYPGAISTPRHERLPGWALRALRFIGRMGGFRPSYEKA